MKPYERWKKTAIHNQLLVITGVLVAVGTLLGACGVGVQLYIQRLYAKQAAEQTDKLIEAANKQAKAAADALEDARNASGEATGRAERAASATEKAANSMATQANATRDIANAARSQSETAKRSMTAGLRAWIGVQGFDHEWHQGRVTVILMNYGRTPAESLSVRVDVARFDRPSLKTIHTDRSTFEFGHTQFFPGVPIPLAVPLGDFTLTEPTDILTGSETVCLNFRIDYSDGFERPDPKDFFYCTDPGGGWSYRPVHTFSELQKLTPENQRK